MNIDGVNFTLSDLSRGKIKQEFINKNFMSDFNHSILSFDISKDLLQNQPEENLYIDNKNYPIFDQSKNIYHGGYIFSTLSYPYEVVYENGEYKIKMVFPELHDLSIPKISETNPYIDKRPKKKLIKPIEPSPAAKIITLMR